MFSFATFAVFVEEYALLSSFFLAFFLATERTSSQCTFVVVGVAYKKRN